MHWTSQTLLSKIRVKMMMDLRMGAVHPVAHHFLARRKMLPFVKQGFRTSFSCTSTDTSSTLPITSCISESKNSKWDIISCTGSRIIEKKKIDSGPVAILTQAWDHSSWQIGDCDGTVTLNWSPENPSTCINRRNLDLNPGANRSDLVNLVPVFTMEVYSTYPTHL